MCNYCCVACSLASELVEMLGASTEVPDPGSWDIADVCFWMEGHTVCTVEWKLQTRVW